MHSQSIIARFSSKVDENGPVPAHRPELGPCHLWTASVDHKGYGKMWVSDESGHRCRIAPRIAWEIAFGAVPDGLWVLHHCDVPRCVRSDHLWLGTSDDNVRDMITKRRWTMNGAKITAETANLIRARYGDGGVSMAALGNEYGLSLVQIWRIVHGKRWHHQ